MMMSNAFISFGCILFLSSTAFALRCFECSHLPDPTDCGVVTDCPLDSSCFLESIFTAGGKKHFNSGCRALQRCSNKREVPHIQQKENNSTGNEFKRSDISLCETCCGKDYCNQHGCGYPGVQRSQRGPFCYNCPAQLDGNTCRSIKQCDLSRVCLIQNSTFSSGEYSTGCIQQQQCRAIETLPNSFSATQSVTGQQHDGRPFCCNDDFCNIQTNSHHHKVDGHWSAWSHWTSCTASCGLTALKLRNRGCDNPLPSPDGMDCVGKKMEVVPCNKPNCPVSDDIENIHQREAMASLEEP